MPLRGRALLLLPSGPPIFSVTVPDPEPMVYPHFPVSRRTSYMTRPSLAAHQPSVDAQLGHFYGNVPVGICLLDTEFRYLRVNKTLAEINAVPVADHIGRTVAEIIPDVAPTLDPYLRRAMETGEPIEDIVVRVAPVGEPGAARDWSTSLYPLTSGDGTVTCVSVMVREVTDLDRIRQAAEDE